MKSSPWSQSGYNKKSPAMEENKTMRAPQYQHPVRKGTVLTSCGIPPRVTCDEIIPGTYIHGIHVHQKKTRRVKRNDSKSLRTEKPKKGRKSETKHNHSFAQGVGRVPRGQVYCLLVRSVGRPNRHGKTRRNTRRYILHGGGNFS